MAATWDRLPELILTHVYSFLDRRDRVAASEVCEAWSRALRAPSIWRHVCIRLDRDLLQPPDPQVANNKIVIKLSPIGSKREYLKLLITSYHSIGFCEDIFNGIVKSIERVGLSWDKLTSVTTDGAPSMTGVKQGFRVNDAICTDRRSRAHILHIQCLVFDMPALDSVRDFTSGSLESNSNILKPKEPLAVHLIRLFGQHMHRMDLMWTRPLAASLQIFPRPRIPRGAQVEAGVAFLSLLRTSDVQIQALYLFDWVYSYKWEGRSKLLFALTIFLSSQRKLRVLNIQNASLSLGEAMRLLTAVSRSCGSVLKSLDLRGAFREWQVPHTSPRYLALLGHLTALSILRLDYSALSDAVLTALSVSTGNSLTQLQVAIRDTDNHQHALSDGAWSHLVTSCPNLRVAFSIVNITHYEDLCHFLLSSIPLNNFYLYSGSVWDQSRSRNFRRTVQRLLNYYTNTLEDVHLHLKNNREMLDDLLLQLLTRSSHLSNLQYDGILRNMNTVREICNLQLSLKTNFHTLHVRPRNLNNVNRSIVRDIRSKYTSQLAEQKVDLKIEDPSSIIVFS
ncbi:F-box only protein 39-like [Periplaneta americana]|uniref:F-box only protein 39-like n=1 Tax=Periplaneta americana TaxID=6978 RepID=UPI0037E7CE63